MEIAKLQKNKMVKDRNLKPENPPPQIHTHSLNRKD